MKEEEVKQLYEKLSAEQNVPTPTYIFYKRVVEHPSPWLKLTRYSSCHLVLKKEHFDDPFGLILLSKGKRGMRKDEVVHEFFHYVDHVRGFESDEKHTRYRTKKYLHKTRIPRV